MTLSSTDTYRNEYDKLGSILPGKNLVWFKRLRDQSIAKFSKSGFFDIKNEDWHFTNLSVLRDRAYSSSAMSEGTFDTKSLKGIGNKYIQANGKDASITTNKAGNNRLALRS